MCILWNISKTHLLAPICCKWLANFDRVYVKRGYSFWQLDTLNIHDVHLCKYFEDTPDAQAKCHMVPTWDVINDDGCQSTYHIDIGKCEGTCGEVSDSDCCRPSSSTNVSVSLKCGDGSTRQTLVSDGDTKI